MLSDLMLRQMVDAMPMPVFVKNQDGDFVYLNHAFETLFHVRATDVIGSDAELPQRLAASGRMVESTTFATSTGDELTMSLVHTEAFAPNDDTELEAAKAELKVARAELARMRETDPVTQALSRRALQAHVHDAFAAAPAGVLRISVDDYATIAEQFGPDIADELLSHFGDIVRLNTRPNDLFARTGESEFTLLLPEADRAQTAAVAERICALATEARTADGQSQLALSVSVGGAFSDSVDAQLPSLIEEAERALRSAAPCRNEAVVL